MVVAKSSVELKKMLKNVRSLSRAAPKLHQVSKKSIRYFCVTLLVDKQTDKQTALET